MADRRSPKESKPLPSHTGEDEQEEHDFNPIRDPIRDEDIVIPGIVPPEGHEFHNEDNEATGVDESQLEQYEADIAVEYVSDTQHTDGSTYNPSVAEEQGLVYTPPTDPPVIPGDNYESGEMGAGFAPSMEETDPNALDLPDQVDNNDWDLVRDIEEALRLNSETHHLDLTIQVTDGIVTVRGTVQTADDIGRAEHIIADLEGVYDVISEVELADESID